MKRMFRFIAFMVGAILMCTAIQSVALADEQVTAGLNVIILLDCTNSLETKGSNDVDRVRLDASVMLINMCSFSGSKVAVVPFTDRVYTKSGTNGSSGWSEWTDISDPLICRELCEKLMEMSTEGGNTNMAPALLKAEELMNENADTENNTVILLLTDGDTVIKGGNDNLLQAEIDKANRESKETAARLKENGAYVYGILLNKEGKADPNAADLLGDIVGTAQIDADVSKYLWTGVRPGDLKDRFSDVFADMIGTKRKQVSVDVLGGDVVTSVKVPNRSISEINIVLPISLTSDVNQISLTRNGEEPKPDGYYIFSKDGNTAKERYDFLSVKLTDVAEPGEWVLRMPAASEDVDVSDKSADVLYNYDLQLVSTMDTRNQFYLNDNIHFEAYFQDGTGAPSNDDCLYRRENGEPAIPATLTITKDGQSVSRVMQNNEMFLNYAIDFSVEELRDSFADPYGEYCAVITAAGDELFRSSETMTFTVSNRKPEFLNEKTTYAFSIENPFSKEGVTDSVDIDLNNYFSDPDGDELTFTGSSTEGLSVLMQNTNMHVSPTAGADGAQSLYITASDGYESENVELTFSVVNVSQMLKNGGVTCSIDVEDSGNCVKGGTAKFVLNYDIDETLEDCFTVEELKAGSVVEFTVNGEQAKISDVDDSFEYTFGKTAASYVVAGIVTVNGMDAPICEASFDCEIKNNDPCALPAPNEKDAEIDLDKGQEWDVDLTEVFGDADIPDGDNLIYSVVLGSDSDNNGWNGFALKILRLVGLQPKHTLPDILTPAEYEEESGMTDSSLKLRLNGVGQNSVDLSVVDLDEARADYSIKLNAVSAEADFMCMILYGIMAAMAIALMIHIIYELVYRRKWPKADYSGKRDGIECPVRMKSRWPVVKRGRSRGTLNDFYKFKESGTPSENTKISSILKSIRVWPVIGGNLKVKLKGKKPDGLKTAKLGQTDLLKKKGVWRDGGTLNVIIEIPENGSTKSIELEWRRYRNERF